MKNSFSPGITTIVYYVIAAIIGIVLFYLLPQWTSNFGWIAFYVVIIGYFTIVLLIECIGFIVKKRERIRRQKSRDDLAASIAKLRKTAIPNKGRQHNYFLYLRPFSSTGKIKIKLKSKNYYHRVSGYKAKAYITDVWGDLETTLAEAVEPLGTFLALGKPGEHLGAGRVFTDDSHWRDEFFRLAHGAKGILIVPSTHSGTKWEIEQLLYNPFLLYKTIFIIPPEYHQAFFPNSHYDETSKFEIENPDINSAIEIKEDAFNCMNKLGIKLSRNDAMEGLFLNIDNKRRVVGRMPFWVAKKSVISSLWNWYSSINQVVLSIKHIHDVIKQFSSQQINT